MIWGILGKELDKKKMFHLEGSCAQEDVGIFLCIIIYSNFIY